MANMMHGAENLLRECSKQKTEEDLKEGFVQGNLPRSNIAAIRQHKNVILLANVANMLQKHRFGRLKNSGSKPTSKIGAPAHPMKLSENLLEFQDKLVTSSTRNAV